MNGVADVHILKVLVEYMLSKYQYNDAIFLAERLYDQEKTASTGILLATCYYQSGRVQQALHLSSSYLSTSPQAVLLHARCCLKLKLYREGLTHLQGLMCGNLTDYESLKNRFGGEVDVALCLLGDLNRKLNFIEEASKMYQLALKHNPFLWSAYESLCQLGKAVLTPQEYFTCNGIPSFLRNKCTEETRSKEQSKSSSAIATSFKPVFKNPLHTVGAPEMFKPGLADSSTPVPAALNTIRMGGAYQRSPSLMFDSSKGISGLSPLDTPQAVLDFSATTPLSSTYTVHTNTQMENAKISNIPSIARHSIHAIGSPDLRPIEMSDLAPIQQSTDEECLSTPITRLATPSGMFEPSHSQESVTPFNAPPRSLNPRRSARLCGGVGKSPSSMSISKHRTEMIPSALTQSRSKARLKSIKSPGTKKRVKFVGQSKVSSPQKPQPLSLTQPQENEDPQLQTKDTDDEKQEEERMDTTSTVAREELTEEMMKKAIDTVLDVLILFGSAYKSLMNYQSKEAVNLLSSIPAPYKNSLWVLTHLGQAMTAREKFKEAARYYSRVHLIDPHRQEGMDQYAAALWHLQKENELSTLVEDLQSSDKTRPEGLCAMSSLMNLYKEHNAAILYLERAVQLSPHYVYAQTLLGLEHILIKDYDKALLAFQSAINIDPRHFNAWYGMGHLYLKQEKWEMAAVCSRRALSINPSSSVACTQLALILQQQGKLEEALRTVSRAISLNPSNNLPKYHRVLILESCEEFNEALVQMRELTSSLPREPLFYKTMSRILMRVGKPHESVVHMCWALDYAHSARCIVGGGSSMIIMDRGDANQMVESLPGLNDDDFVVHSDSDDFDN